MTTNVRHATAPMPLACRWCGVEQRPHGQRWVPSRRWHPWAEPTRAQIEARMRVNIAKRRGAVPDPAWRELDHGDPRVRPTWKPGKP